MAIIPHFRAEGGPASPNAPTLQRERRARIDASEALQGLGDLVGAVQGSGAPLPTANPNLGQSAMRGLQGIGGVLSDIGQRLEDAKNYADENEAQIAMDREAGEFEKWRLQNHAPETWETEWRSRMEQFGGRYFEGKNVSRRAQEAIRMRLASYTERRAIHIGTDAGREILGRAKSAMQSDILRAQESGDHEAVKGILARAKNLGIIDEFDATRIDLESKQAIDNKRVSQAMNYANASAMRGDREGVVEALDSVADAMDPSEMAEQRAIFDTKTAVSIEVGKFQDRYYSGEDPATLRDELEARNEDGTFAHHPEFSPTLRAELLGPIHKDINEEFLATVEGLKSAVDDGVPLREVSASDAFRSLPDALQRSIGLYAEKGAKDDTAAFLTAMRTAQAYDPANDPRGDELAALRASALLGFRGERVEQLFSALDDAAARTEPQTAIDRVASDYFANLQRRFERGEMGAFLVNADDITKRTDKNGATIYVVPDPEGDYQEEGSFLGRTFRGRIVELSEEDKAAFEAEKLEGKSIEDIRAREKAFSRFQSVQEGVSRMVADGEVTNADDLTAAGNRLLGDEFQTMFDSAMESDSSGASFGEPDGSPLPPQSPDDAGDWLDNYSVTF